MTFDELRERIKEEIVLHEGDLAEWEWQRKGLLTEAAQLGLSSADFFRLVNQVSHTVLPDFARISDLKGRILERARQTRKQIPESDLRQFTEEADRLQLSRLFLTERWIPALLKSLPDQQPEPADPAPPQVSPPPKEELQTRIRRILSRYDRHLTAHQLEVLFDAIDYDPDALAEEILAYLSASYFAAVDPPKGATLREKLLSTDWRHLSWWQKTPESPVSPPIPAATVPAPPPRTAPPPPLPEPEPKRSRGLSDSAIIGLAIAAVVVMLIATIWVIRSEPETPEPASRSERISRPRSDTEASAESSRRPTQTAGKQKRKRATPTSGSPRPYDEVEEAGEFGLRPARSGDKWGFVDRQDRWVIEPRYDAVTAFEERRAQVVLNGRPFYIDRFGNRIKRE